MGVCRQFEPEMVRFAWVFAGVVARRLEGGSNLKTSYSGWRQDRELTHLTGGGFEDDQEHDSAMSC